MTATDELRALLTSDWQPATEVQRKAEALGMTREQLRTARKRLGVTKDGGAVAIIDGHWHWRLPRGGCPLCQRPWGSGGSWGDYWTHDRRSAPVSTEEPDDIGYQGEPSAPTSPPVPVPYYDPARPPTCSVCGKASASDFGSRCPWQSVTGQRCPGTMT